MPREKESYRDNLARIIARYPNKEMLTKKETAAFIGCDVRTASKMFHFNELNRISIAKLAREMS